MEKLIKRAGLALATFGLATSALAGSYEPGCQCEVTIPKCDGGFRIGIEKLWFTPYVSGTYFATTDEANNDSVKRINVDNDYELGFKVELAYCFPGTGNDVVLSYEHHDFEDSTRVNGAAANAPSALGTNGANPLVLAAVALGANDFAKGSYDVEHHVIDLEFGQAVNFGKNVTIRFHSGFRYVDTDVEARSLVALSANNAIHTVSAKSEFDGIGPRVGMDCTWHVGSGFDLLTELSTSMLIGDVDNKLNLSYVDDTPANLSRRFTSNVDDCVVANMDVRVGARYTYVFSNNAELGLEVGYHASNFMGFDGKSSPDNSLTDGAGCGCDFAAHGLYVRADYAM